MKLEKDHPVFQDIAAIKQAGESAANLTRQLLAFSRKQVYSPKILDLNNMINGLDKTIFHLIGEDIEIKKELREDIGKILADPGQIEQILINLIVNARDAINDHTEIAAEKQISISTKHVELDQNFAVNNIGSSPGKHVLISVSDNGIGIKRDILNKIFEPFFTTKETDKGTGLGLATVYGIVKQNNGSIFVESREGKGTTFKIYWPESDKDLKKAGDDKSGDAIQMGNETILIVEDNMEVKKIASANLRSLGYKVYETSNGREAYEMLKEKKIPVDLILTDIIMPKMSGRELSEKLKEMYPSLKILFTSGYTDNEIVANSQLVDGVEFIQKPYSLPLLADKIREVLNK
jgi:CheY-like chemotaxis protein